LVGLSYGQNLKYVFDVMRIFDANEVASMLEAAKPGQDYPNYNEIPASAQNYNCGDKKGFYADVSTQCQVFHRCDVNGNHTAYLCVNTTVFNQVTLICDYYFNVDCSKSKQYENFANSRLYTDQPLFDTPPADYVVPAMAAIQAKQGTSAQGRAIDNGASGNQVQPSRGNKPAPKPAAGGKATPKPKATTTTTAETTPAAEETTTAAAGDTTAAAGGDQDTTAAPSDQDTTAAAGGDQDTTAAAGGDQDTTAAAGGDQDTTAAGGDQDTTAAPSGEDTTAAAGGDQDTTAASGGDQDTTAAAGGDTTAAAGGDQTTAGSDETTTSAAEETTTAASS